MQNSKVLTQKNPFRKVSYLKRSELIADEIKRWIATESRETGYRLPQEKELVEAFSASKGTIREALKSLEVQGLIHTNTGPKGGAKVSRVSYRTTAELLGNYFYFKNIDADKLYSMRRIIEPDLAVLAMEHLTSAQFSQLEDLISICEGPSQATSAKQARRLAELEFHAIIYKACPNELMSFVGRFINDFLIELVHYENSSVLYHNTITLENLDHHKKILQALRSGNSSNVRQTMVEHMADCQRHAEQMEATVAKRFWSQKIAAV